MSSNYLTYLTKRVSFLLYGARSNASAKNHVVELSNSFFETTRGRIVTMLRPGPRTVEELAKELGVTDNAVRAQLQGLERDGMIQPAGSRRTGGAGKPPRVYELTPDAEQRLSHAFAPFLDAVLAAAAQRLTPAEMDQILESVGIRLARAHPAPSGVDHINHALSVVRMMGGAPTAMHERNSTTISASGCVLGAVVANHPAACQGMRAMLSELTGCKVETHCEHHPKPRCRFIVT